MGGIGAAGVSLHRPDVYAAAAPLCGYHSYFVRGDTRGVRRPWETFLMELRSNDHWAENGLHLPMYIVQGTRDRPLSNSQTLADRYTALGYRLEVEWPDLGHDVWSTTYAGGRIVPHFLRFSRDEAPRTLRFRTPDLRWNRSAWLTLDALSLDGGATGRTGRWGEVELSVERNGSARGVTRGVAALTLHPPASLVDRGVSALTLDLDGDRVALPLDRATSLVRRAGHWATGTRPVVRGGGALREVFDGPVLVVIGTGDPAATRLYERVARTWSRRTGSTVHYPVVHDDSLTDAMTAGRTLVLIGTPRDHRLLAQWRDRLPLRLDDDAIALGSQRFEGPDVGAAFAAPNPDDPRAHGGGHHGSLAARPAALALPARPQPGLRRVGRSPRPGARSGAARPAGPRARGRLLRRPRRPRRTHRRPRAGQPRVGPCDGLRRRRRRQLTPTSSAHTPAPTRDVGGAATHPQPRAAGTSGGTAAASTPASRGPTSLGRTTSRGIGRAASRGGTGTLASASRRWKNWAKVGHWASQPARCEGPHATAPSTDSKRSTVSKRPPPSVDRPSAYAPVTQSAQAYSAPARWCRQKTPRGEICVKVRPPSSLRWRPSEGPPTHTV
jgi:hypothetical protein